MSSMTVSELGVDPDELDVPERPTPLSSLTAAGQRITKGKVKVGVRKQASWQEDAWDMYDLVGEQRFLANTLANRMAQARFFAAKMPQDTTEDLEPLKEGPAYDCFRSLAGKGAHFSQMVTRAGINLFVPGDFYLVGIPKEQDGVAVQEKEEAPPQEGITPIGRRTTDAASADPLADIDIDSLEWRLFSSSELTINPQSGEITAIMDAGVKRKFQTDDVILINVWRPHPRHWWQADSPTRSSLPVQRELVGLTMKISADIDSRLAGSGLLLVPQSADEAMRAQQGTNSEDDESPYAKELVEYMITPLSDRSSASSVVPLVSVVPDDSVEKFRFISFASESKSEDRALREEAIRRLALGEDCPPELLLGVAGMNHWGAWLVREDVVTTHLEPPLALICDAITTQFLWPVLEQQGVTDFEEYVIWYDVDHLIQRPNRSEDAKAAKQVGAISDKSYRDALGFDESDAPDVAPRDPVHELVLDMLRIAPSLAVNPGLAVLAQQIKDMLAGLATPPPAPEATPTEDVTDDQTDEQQPTEGSTPATDTDPAEEPDSVAASAKLEAERVFQQEFGAPNSAKRRKLVEKMFPEEGE